MRFSVLGPVVVEQGGRSISLPGARERCVLGILLLAAGQPVSTDRLAALVWADEAPPVDTRAAIQTYMSRLRRALATYGKGDEPAVTRVADGYLIDLDPEAVDLHCFDRLVETARATRDADDRARLLREALALWKGPALANIGPAPLRDRIAVPVDARRMAALRLRIDADLELGLHRELIGELSALVAEHPLDEDVAQQLILALYRSGQRAEALEVYRRIRRSLADTLGLDPSMALRELEGAVLRGDHSLNPTGAPEDAIDRCQLPPDLGDFTGRLAELAELLQVPGAVERAVTVITGPGGVGKTALAVRAAHLLRPAFRHGQLFLPLHGSGPEPHSAAHALRLLLRGVGSTGTPLADDVDQLSARFRSLVADRQILLVVDDVASAAQLRPLLPGTPTCRVVATSRYTLTGLDGARLMELDAMAPSEASALLGRVVGAERTARESHATEEVVELCARLPLALRVAGARLAARPRWTVRYMADRLADRRRRLDELVAEDLDVRATFALTYESLSPAHARAFALLAASQLRDISVFAAAALLDVPETSAEALAEGLVDTHLLMTPTAGRYRHHDLLRLFAEEQLTSEINAADRARALSRLHEAYLRATTSAARALWPGNVGADGAGGRLDAVAARSFLDQEHLSVVTVLVEAAELASTTVAAAHGLLCHIHMYLRAGGHWNEWERAAQALLAAAIRTSDAPAHSTALRELGQLAVLRGRPGEGEGWLDQALVIARQTLDRNAEAQSLIQLGLLEYARSRFDQALIRHEAAFRMWVSLGNRGGMCRSLINVAMCRTRVGDARGGLEALARARRLAEELEDHQALVMVLHHTANGHARLGHHDQAIDAHLHCLRLTQDAGHREGEAHTLGQLGKTYFAAGQSRRAADTLQTAVARFRELQHPLAIATCLNELGKVYRELGRPHDAMLAWREARGLVGEIDPMTSAELDRLLASTHPNC